jgi:hypothetical protein
MPKRALREAVIITLKTIVVPVRVAEATEADAMLS